MHHLDAFADLVRLQPHQLEQANLRDGKALATGVHHEGGNDSQREGNFDLDGGSLAGGGMDIDGAADFFDVGLHHVHADAPSGNIRHFFGGRKTRKENEIENIAVLHACRLLGREHAAFDCGPPDAVQVQAGAIVGDFDVDLPAFVEGAQNQAPGRILARFFAVFGQFDAMVDAVAYQVGERIFDGFDDGAVQVGFLAFHFDPDFLAAVEREIADGAGKFVPDVANGLHASAHDLFLQFAGNEVHALGERLKAGILGAVGKLQQLVARQYQFADQVHEAVEQGDADADGFDPGIGIAGFESALRRLHVLLADNSLTHQNLSYSFAAFFLLLQGTDKIIAAYVPVFEQ